jgi:hypothetical protein
MTIERYGTKKEALAAEKLAIKSELPLYNKMHSTTYMSMKKKHNMNNDTAEYIDVRMAKDIILLIEKLSPKRKRNGVYYAVVDARKVIENHFRYKWKIHKDINFNIIDHVLPDQVLFSINKDEKLKIEKGSKSECMAIISKCSRFTKGNNMYDEYEKTIVEIKSLIRNAKAKGNVLRRST